MNEKNSRKLFVFNLFVPSDPKSSMKHGFECSNGWFYILYQLCQDLDKMKKPDDFQIVQVKQQMGILSIECNKTTKEIFERIRQAENESTKICEICGERGRLRIDGWRQTLCEKCKKRKNNRPIVRGLYDQ